MFFYDEKGRFLKVCVKNWEKKLERNQEEKLGGKIRRKNQEEKLDGYYGLETVIPILHFLTFMHYAQVHNCFQDIRMVLPAWVDQYPRLLSRLLRWSPQARTEVCFWHLQAHLQGLFRFLLAGLSSLCLPVGCQNFLFYASNRQYCTAQRYFPCHGKFGVNRFSDYQGCKGGKEGYAC